MAESLTRRNPGPAWASPGPGDAATRLARLDAEFAVAASSVSRVYVRHQGNAHFITGSATDTLLFPQSEPAIRPVASIRMERDRGDGVSYGRFHGRMSDLCKNPRGESRAPRVGLVTARPTANPGCSPSRSSDPPRAGLTIAQPRRRGHRSVPRSDHPGRGTISGSPTSSTSPEEVAPGQLRTLTDAEIAEVARSRGRSRKPRPSPGVVLESLFGPEQIESGTIRRLGQGEPDRQRTLAISEIPTSAINDVLTILMATNRTIPPSQFVDACRAARDRDYLERLV